MSRSIFFGYPEYPKSQASTMQAFASGLAESPGCEPVTWQQLQVDGRVVLSEILTAIDASSMAIFDVSNPNPNVLFEAGYAIARAKPVWLTLDSTTASASAAWKLLGLTRDIGYTSYRNSADLLDRFTQQNPLDTLEPVYDALIEPSLPDEEVARDTLLYCTTFEPFEAANRLNAFIGTRERYGTRLAVADPAESSVVQLRWYVRELARSAGVLVHFAGQNRNHATLHNNRHALIAGIALGLQVPTLLLAEEDYPAPFDYESMLKVYETAEECVEDCREWIDTLDVQSAIFSPRRNTKANALAPLRFGEHVAENERSELGDYFVETAAFADVVAARDSIFVGHRGTGKTANAMQAFSRIASDKRNLAVLVKPPGFEFPAMMAVVGALPHYQHDYFFDALWRFVIQTEIAAAIWRRLSGRQVAVGYDAEEQSFIDYVDNAPFDLRADISVRLSQALGSLRQSLADEADSDGTRNYINEAFHAKALSALRAQLGRALKNRNRVAVFVDNLDKGWERGTDFAVMARFILGLLSARGQVVTDFQKQDYWRDSIKLTVAVFLRSDIYSYLRREAREPDKLPISAVTWRDWSALRTVVEERFVYSSSGRDDANDLWGRVFCESVDGEPLQQYLARVVLPRPRDIVFMCNAAVGRAIDRGHSRIEEDDLKAARETYSQYAYEALLVENGVTIPEMADALLSFIDTPATLTRLECAELLRVGGIADSNHERLITKLTSMSFFGLEVRHDNFAYPEVGSESAAATVRSTHLQPDADQQRLRIHPAFWTFLGITEEPPL